MNQVAPSRSHLLRRAVYAATLSVYSLVFAGPGPEGAVQFNKDIRPILSDTCFPCHGFDSNKRKADLRLDTAEGLVAVHSGHQAVKGGDLAGSELWARITTNDPKKQMPPPDSGKKLKPEQVEVLKRWIQQGGIYQKHWAFVAPVRPPVPSVQEAQWARNDVDRFILATLESKGLKPSSEAPREALLRRVTLALTGLPPTPAEVDAFLADTQPGAYERVVDRLLASPHFGEEMAHYWLDLARYGDTHGMHIDNERGLWPYRDWVVRAFNENLPYDKFTIWQLAGDLLPNATREQKIASGFNRCNMSTSEGGAIDEEFRVRYAVDRVETTSTTWMGLTMGCAVCHDHKLDPIYQKEFYQVFSIFNNIAENAMDGNQLLPPPVMQLPSPEQEKKLAELDARKTELERRQHELLASFNYTDPAAQTNMAKAEPREIVWLEDDFPAEANVMNNEGNTPGKWVSSEEGPVFSGKRSLLRAGKGLHQTFFDKCKEPLTLGAGDKFFAYVYLDPKDPPKSIMLQFHTDGWNNRANWGDEDAIPYGEKKTKAKVLMGALPEAGKWVRLEVPAAKLGLDSGMRVTGIAFTLFDGKAYWDKTGLLSLNDPAQDPGLSFAAWEKSERKMIKESTAPEDIKVALKKQPAKRDAEEQKKLKDYYLVHVYNAPDSPLHAARGDLASVQKERDELMKEIPSTMISKELDKPRPAWVLIRGQYDKHGEPVGPGVPSILPPMPACDATNRLTFAKWLVDGKHPLTARVEVNRLWQQFFGIGIVKTAEDFGTKGEWPSHPELLDWMATEFMDSGWDLKHMVRLLVTSATYQQDSRSTPELVQLDPENRLLAHGPRFRLDAEELRDNALFVSGLLDLDVGGRGVRPYQPPGIWEAVSYTTSNTGRYTQDHGEALYRRALYVFLKRTAPPPFMSTFDAPSREKCCARRERTNTPLQALMTMNDPQFFEAARHLGYRMLHEGGARDDERLAFGFRLATARKPTAQEESVLEETLKAERERYQDNPSAAKKAIEVGESPVPSDVPAPELASYTMVANLLLNLDEVLTKN